MRVIQQKECKQKRIVGSALLAGHGVQGQLTWDTDFLAAVRVCCSDSPQSASEEVVQFDSLAEMREYIRRETGKEILPTSGQGASSLPGGGQSENSAQVVRQHLEDAAAIIGLALCLGCGEKVTLVVTLPDEGGGLCCPQCRSTEWRMANQMPF